MTNNEEQPSRLPDWVPWGGRYVYETITTNGGYEDQRLASAMRTIFFDTDLGPVWKSLGALSLSQDGWSFLIGGIITAIECAPKKGKRATRDTDGDEKISIRKRQEAANKLLAKIASTSEALSKLLNELERNGGKTPTETESGLALIEAAIREDGVSKACCSKEFEDFKRKLSSYAKIRFPSPAAMFHELANAANRHPNTAILFSEDPWLSSSHSSWKDYVRVLNCQFAECKQMYGAAPDFSDAHWTLLIAALIDNSISRQTVSKGLKEL